MRPNRLKNKIVIKKHAPIVLLKIKIKALKNTPIIPNILAVVATESVVQ
jgi:hypothetical protein